MTMSRHLSCCSLGRKGGRVNCKIIILGLSAWPHNCHFFFHLMLTWECTLEEYFPSKWQNFDIMKCSKSKNKACCCANCDKARLSNIQSVHKEMLLHSLRRCSQSARSYSWTTSYANVRVVSTSTRYTATGQLFAALSGLPFIDAYYPCILRYLRRDL